MTRKKSNVKALALAVTCAILAGGYSGLSPVYAADATANFTDANITGSVSGTVDSTSSTFNGTITSGKASGTLTISAASIVESLKDQDIHSKTITANAAGFNGLMIRSTETGPSIAMNEGAITATGNITASQFTVNGQSITADKIQGYDTAVANINNTATGLAAKASQSDLDNLKTVVGDDSGGLVKNVKDLTSKTVHLSDDGSTLTSMTTVQAETLKVGDQVITADKIKEYNTAVTDVDALKTKTQKITYDSTSNMTKIDGNVSITGGVGATNYVKASSFVQAGDGKGVFIRQEGIFIGADKGHPNEQKMAIKNDGSIIGVTDINNGKIKFEGNDIYINKGKDQQITIDSNGIKVGNGTAYISDGGFKVTDDKTQLTAAGLQAKEIHAGGSRTEFVVDAAGNVTAAGTYNGVELKDGAINAAKGGTIGRVIFAAQGTTDSVALQADSAKLGSLTIKENKITSDTAQGVIGLGNSISVNDNGEIDGVKKIDGVSVAANGGTGGGLKIGDNAIIGASGTPFQSEGFSVDNDGDIVGKSFKAGTNVIDANGITANAATIGGVNTLDDKGLKTNKVTFTNSYLSEGELHLNNNNNWTDANGITASKAAINGVTIGETAGKATFTNGSGTTTTIDGDNITAGTITAAELKVDKISLGKDNENITINKDGNIDTKGKLTIKDAAGNVVSEIVQDKATFGNDTVNQTIIEKGKITAKVKNAATSQQSKLTHDENGFTVAGMNAESKESSFNFSTATGIGTFTGQDGTTTTINGSKITSTNNGKTGVLDGSNLTLEDGTKKTELTAGGVIYNNGTDKTEINGGTITTETLRTNKLILGNQDGDSDIVLNADGSFSAANGAFAVDKNGRTTFVKDADNQTAINGGNIYAQAKSAASGAKSRFLHTGDGVRITGENGAGDVKTAYDFDTDTGKATIEKTTGGVTSSTTIEGSDVKLDDGQNNKTNITAGGATFTKDSGEHAGTTTIDGNTIKTGHLITDKLTITGSGNADGSGSTPGSVAFGADGTIKSDIIDGNDHTTFETTKTGTTTTVTDGTTTTTNKVEASGNTNTVKEVTGNNSSSFTQTTTSIGGVVTNGTVSMKQELTTDGMKIYDENDTPDKNYTQVTNKDVSIADQKNDGNRINLSDLGQIDNIDGELQGREEFKNNSTAVGGLNAEAAIRREEVARLDNRIDDVNNRVNKVGAMAAAIASLKSIGYDPQAPSEFSIGLGQYKGETGIAMGFFHYPNKNFMVNVSLSTAGGETMGGIGATWRFGHKSPQKLLEEQRAAQAKKELAAAEKYQAAAQLAKEAQERAEYAAKLARQAQVSADNAKAAADATQAKHFQ